MLKHFKPVEFERCTPRCLIGQMDSCFLELLDEARDIAGVPFKLNSAYRPRWYELQKGRSGSGYHTLGRAVDIDCDDSKSRAAIVSACLAVGLSCGIDKSFIHVDNRRSQIVFLY